MFDETRALLPLKCIDCAFETIPKVLLLDGKAGQNEPLLFKQIRGVYQFAGDSATLPFKLDTGAVVSLIKTSDWVKRRSKIHWLHEPGVPPLASKLPARTYKLAGINGTVQVWFGRVCLRMCTTEVTRQAAAFDLSLVAAFDVNGVAKTTLLGLGGGAFIRGGLCVNGVMDVAHLIEA